MGGVLGLIVESRCGGAWREGAELVSLFSEQGIAGTSRRRRDSGRNVCRVSDCVRRAPSRRLGFSNWWMLICSLRGSDFRLYAFVMQDRPERYGSRAGKAVWNILLEATSSISGQHDDTDAAVATWAFLHGYATLEHSGAFGPSGPRGGLERGVEAFLANFRNGAHSALKEHPARVADTRQRKRK